MNGLVQAGKNCLSTGNLLAAVAIALTVPDVLGSRSTGHVGQRYRTWFNQWAASKFLDDRGEPYITADDCFRLRCATLHEGTADLGMRRETLHEVQFYDDSLSKPFLRLELHTCPTRHLLLVRARDFSERLYESAEEHEAQFTPLKRISRWKYGLQILDQDSFDQEYGLGDWDSPRPVAQA